MARGFLRRDGAPLPRWLMPLCALVLLPFMARALWSDSVDLAHHYALTARLLQHWTLPPGYDPSLGEMNVYPRGAHLLAAVFGRMADSAMLGMQLVTAGAALLVWCVLLSMLRALPPRMALQGGLALLALQAFNLYRHWYFWLYGAEVVDNYFFSQLVGQAVAALAALAALQLERRRVAPSWRYVLLGGTAYLCVSVHLLPALQLLALMGLLAVSELRREPLRRSALAFALTAVTALLVWSHPTFAVMQSISSHNGGIGDSIFNSRSVLTTYAALLALLSAGLLWRWLRLSPAAAAQALGLKYLSLLGLTVALLCLTQLGALMLGSGSDYATKKYIFGLNSMMLLELGLLFASLRRSADTPFRPWQAVLQALLWPLLLVMLTIALYPSSRPSYPLARLVDTERQLVRMRDLYLSASAAHPSYATGLPGLSPGNAYALSLGVFGAPRDANASDVLSGQAPSDMRDLASIVTAPDHPYAQRVECRRPGGTAQLAVLDGACLDRWQHPPGTLIDLRRRGGDNDCQLSGFSQPEGGGRWSDGPRASISCPVPDLRGLRPGHLSLTIHAFVDHVPQQRLTLRLNGGPAQQFSFDSPAPQVLDLPLPAGGARVALTLELPDARSPQSLGLSGDSRQLGVLLSTLEFR